MGGVEAVVIGSAGRVGVAGTLETVRKDVAVPGTAMAKMAGMSFCRSVTFMMGTTSRCEMLRMREA